MVESSSDEILEGAQESDIAFLVVGDPFGYFIWPLKPIACADQSRQGNYTH